VHMKSIFDRSFHYVCAAETDVRKTFKRILKNQREEDKRKAQNAAEAKIKVTHMKVKA
jgi:hypothetical protein